MNYSWEKLLHFLFQFYIKSRLDGFLSDNEDMSPDELQALKELRDTISVTWTAIQPQVAWILIYNLDIFVFTSLWCYFYAGVCLHIGNRSCGTSRGGRDCCGV